MLAAAAAGLVIGLVVGRGPTPEADSVDVRFMQDMTIHHEQAVAMSWVAIRNEASSPVRGLATDIIMSQQREIGMMAAMLDEFGEPTYPARRTVMEWMGPPFPAADMPGLASIEELDALGRLQGDDIDRMFLELMIVHHLGGIEMTGFALTEASNSGVRELAEIMDHTQTVEIGQMERMLDVLPSVAS